MSGLEKLAAREACEARARGAGAGVTQAAALRALALRLSQAADAAERGQQEAQAPQASHAPLAAGFDDATLQSLAGLMIGEVQRRGWRARLIHGRLSFDK